MEEEEIMKVMARMVMDFIRQRERRDEAYGYEKLEGQGRREFDRWVALVKAPRSATKAFREFEHHFAQFSERDRRSVGAKKSNYFLSRSIEKEE